MTKESDSPVSRERLRSLPQLPGIYLMKNAEGTVIYVGKAKLLRARVRSYFTGTITHLKTRFLVNDIHSIETIVTSSETEALVLESDLVKKFKPRYNVRLKDDKAHLLVRIDWNHQWPRLELVRKVFDDGAQYIGPFAFTYELRSILEVIKRTLPLRTCSDRVIYNRVRPCLEYQIKRCSGPCCIKVDHEQYLQWTKQAVDILLGKNHEVVQKLEQEMEGLSDDLRYEEAAVIRDRIESLKNAQRERTSVNYYGLKSKDVFGLYRDEKSAELTILQVRQGRLFGSRSFQLDGLNVPERDLLGQLMSQFYDLEQDVPEEILIPIPMEDKLAREELYSLRRGKRVRILTPNKGARKKLLALAETNARENFTARGGKIGGDNVLEDLKRELGLEEVPRVMECVDVSHFQGGETVASVVVFKDGQPDRARYRAFKLSQEGKPDDFASMREVVMRHLSRAAEENTLPDLIVVDGGPAQLSQAVHERKKLGLSRPEMVGLAKKRTLRREYRDPTKDSKQKPERVFLPDKPLPIVLRGESETLHLLERIRNEAHRFAISFHRRRRSKRIFHSDLERIPGIGPKRRKDLLRAFGSVQSIRKSTPEEIVSRCKMPLSLAVRILDLLARMKVAKDELEKG